MADGLDEAELVAWGVAVGRGWVEGSGGALVLALRGELGAGKSVLARAVARGVGVTSPMPSPTFNLVFRYEAGGAEVYHVDLYRLEQEEDVWELGWRELGEGRQVVMIEWAGRADALLPVPRWDIHIEATAPDLRRVRCVPVGDPPAIPAPSAP